MKSEIKTKDAKKGGYLVGKPHSEGGIKGINVDTGEPIEVEGGEVVITKPAVQSKEVYMFEGKEMTPKEILSKLNSDHGGVAFEKGGEVGDHYAKGGKIKLKVEKDDDDEGRINISIPNIGQVILVETYPKYEFMEDVDEETMNELGLDEYDLIGKIEHIEVKDEHKGKGYAKILMNKAIEIAEKNDWMPLYLNASPMGFSGLNTQDLTAFYESFGFRVFKRQGHNNLMILERKSYARGGGTRTRRTAAPSFEAEIEVVKKEDKAEKLKYQTLEEIIEQDITKWSILQGLVNKENTLRKNDINRKLAALREERDLYALKQQTSSELLQSLAKVFVKEKITQGTINPELLAPNGQPTMLTEDQYYKVRSQEFVDWYGDWLMAYDLDNYGGVSKTINDATKEPLVLYHGSQHDFARWRFEKFPAAYFADNMSYSQWFANYAGNGLLYQVFVDMKNPIDMRSFGVDLYPIRNYLQFIEENYLITPEQADARVAQFAKTNPENTEQYLDHPCRFWEYIRHINTDLLTYLRDNTFIDGIMMFENNPSDIVDGKENVTGSYVVFRTEQIKWASANHFNLLVKDARFEKGGKIDQSRKDEDILNSIDFGF